MRTHREKASEIYAELMAMIDQVSGNSDAADRAALGERIRLKLSDYSYERFAAGQDEPRT